MQDKEGINLRLVSKNSAIDRKSKMFLWVIKTQQSRPYAAPGQKGCICYQVHDHF